MTRIQYESTRQQLGRLKAIAKRAHRRRDHRRCAAACTEHDTLMLRLLEALR